MSFNNEDDNLNKRIDKTSKEQSMDENENDSLLPTTTKPKIHNFSPFEGLSDKEEKTLTRRLLSILITLTVGVLIMLYIISPLSKLQGITINGAENTETNAIVNSSGLKIGQGIWPQYFKQNREMKQVIDQNPRISSAKLRIRKFNHFSVKVTEYKTLAVLSKDNKIYPVLSNGKILKEQAVKDEKKLPILIGFKEGDGLNTLLKSYEKFSPKIQKEIVSIESQATEKNPFRIKLVMKDGNEVIGLSTTIADKLVFYDKIAAEFKDKRVVDMEAGKSGVFSYPIETQESSSEEGLSDESTTESTNNGF